MPNDVTAGTPHKDLQDLRNLSRSPLHSFMRQTVQPTQRRPKTADMKAARFPALAAFAPTRIWAWFMTYVVNRFGPRTAFRDYTTRGSDTGVYRMPGGITGETAGTGNDIRIAVAGDWGTGTDEAALVARQIAKFDPHYTVHIGDIYYVGDAVEVDEHFLGIDNKDNNFDPVAWPLGSVGTFALSGNHEMYSRGKPYFTRILPALGIKGGTPAGQGASFFCLENEFWRIVAVDTAYNSVGKPLLEYIVKPDCALPEPIITWLRDVVKLSPSDKRGLIILSHHQYYSAFDTWYTKSAMQLAPFLPRPVLWFWGHEHRMTVYEEFAAPGGPAVFGRCIGHGGMPNDLPLVNPPHPECTIRYIDKREYPNDENLRIGYNGFVRFTFRGENLAIEYVDLHGEVVFTESWRVDNGTLVPMGLPVGRPVGRPV